MHGDIIFAELEELFDDNVSIGLGERFLTASPFLILSSVISGVIISSSCSSCFFRFAAIRLWNKLGRFLMTIGLLTIASFVELRLTGDGLFATTRFIF